MGATGAAMRTTGGSPQPVYNTTGAVWGTGPDDVWFPTQSATMLKWNGVSVQPAGAAPIAVNRMWGTAT
jgi:hypothetical protein